MSIVNQCQGVKKTTKNGGSEVTDTIINLSSYLLFSFYFAKNYN